MQFYFSQNRDVEATTVKEDNKGGIRLANNPSTALITNLIDARHPLALDRVPKGDYSIIQVP